MSYDSSDIECEPRSDECVERYDQAMALGPSAIQWAILPGGGIQAVWVSQVPAGTVIDLTGESDNEQ